MNFLGMGPAELIVIIIIALIVLGPGKLPEVARALGKTMRDLRAISDGFQTELRRELNTAAAVKDEVKGDVTPLTETLSSLRASLNAPLVSAEQKPQKEEPTAIAPPEPGASTEVSATSSPADEPTSLAGSDDMPVEYAAAAVEPADPDKTE